MVFADDLHKKIEKEGMVFGSKQSEPLTTKTDQQPNEKLSYADVFKTPIKTTIKIDPNESGNMDRIMNKWHDEKERFYHEQLDKEPLRTGLTEKIAGTTGLRFDAGSELGLADDVYVGDALETARPPPPTDPLLPPCDTCRKLH